MARLPSLALLLLIFPVMLRLDAPVKGARSASPILAVAVAGLSAA